LPLCRPFVGSKITLAGSPEDNVISIPTSEKGSPMPTVPLKQFIETIQVQFPNLKSYDETRLFAVLMQSGMSVEFELDPDGNTMINFQEPDESIKQKLVQQ
jgi:hypothetical protein